jgi:hypothetical protein
MINVFELKKLYNKKDKMHDWSHILRIKNRVKLLRKGCDNIDEGLLQFLVYYHGLKEFVLDNKKEFDRRYVTSLMRHNKKPKLIEEKIVFDANLLDNLGKPGIRKALYVGKMLNRDVSKTKEFVSRGLKGVCFYTRIGKKIGKFEFETIKRWSETE